MTNPMGRTFFDLQKIGQTQIAGLGLAFDEFNIFLSENPEPPNDMLADLVSIVLWPRSRIKEIERRLLSHYDQLRAEYLSAHAEDDLDVEKIARRLPEIEQCHEVWRLVNRPRGINGGTWPHASISFDCTFDIEHQWHVAFSDNQVYEVWVE